MDVRIRQTIALFALAFLLVPGAAWGDGDQGAAALAACRKLSAGGKWDEAVAAYRALFAANEGSPLLHRNLRDIEDDLKRCRFRQSYVEPSAGELYGDGVTYFGKTSLKLQLRYEGKVGGPRWTPVGAVTLLDIRFKDKVQITLTSATSDVSARPFGLLLCYDVEKKGGYVLEVACARRGASAQAVGGIARLDQGQAKLLVTGSTDVDDLRWVRFSRDSSLLQIRADNRQVTAVSDSEYRGGYLALRDSFTGTLEIEAVVDKHFHHQLLGDHENRAFREWLQTGWKPEAELPAWLREPTSTRSGAPAVPLPDDAKGLEPAKIAESIDGCLRGNPAAIARILSVAEGQPARTRSFLLGLAALGTSRLKEAAVLIEELLDGAPGYGPGLAMRGFLCLRLRRMEDARAAFEAAVQASPALEWGHLGLVHLSVYAGDLPAAERAVAAASKAGAMSGELERLAASVQRAKRGPLWTTRYDLATTHFEIASDHSRELCRDAAALLEGAFDSYRKFFPEVTVPERRGRVYVFSGREGFLDYGLDRQRNMSFAAGAYEPSTRELVLYLPLDRTQFTHVVRHEGFHRFLHEFLEDAPLWFNEGCADYFASGRETYGGALAPGAPYGPALATLRAAGDRLTPLDTLLRMDRDSFMKDAGLHYAQSWALVHFLMSTKEFRWSTLLRDYFASLREGVGPEAACALHFAPQIRGLEQAYQSHFRSLSD